MRKAAGKRLPHGETSDLVMNTLWSLHMRAGRPEPVSRADLVRAACRLPETTVDDRLRVLVKQGKVLKLRRGLYAPIYQRSGQILDRYRHDRPPPWWRAASPSEALEMAGRIPRPPNEKKVLIFPEGVVLIERWLSTAEYLRLESSRQRKSYFRRGLIPDLDDQGGPYEF